MAKLEKGGGQSMDFNVGVHKILPTMWPNQICLKPSPISLWESLKSWHDLSQPLLVMQGS
jgi:hypothetical protein